MSGLRVCAARVKMNRVERLMDRDTGTLGRVFGLFRSWFVRWFGSVWFRSWMMVRRPKRDVTTRAAEPRSGWGIRRIGMRWG